MQQTLDNVSFFKYLTQKSTSIRLIITILINIVLYVIFKHFFPNGEFIVDSHGYIQSATNHDKVTFRPVGYSNFLNFFGFKGGSENSVVLFQYIFSVISSLFLYFTLEYFYPIKNKIVRTIFYVFICFNLMNFFIANLILSDSLFTSITISIITLLFWIRHTGKVVFVFVIFLLLYYAFTIRFNSLYYPFFVCLAILLSYKMKLVFRVIGCFAIFISFYAFYNGQQKLNEEMFGSKILSGFSGWQIANNALYIYPHIKVDREWLDTKELKDLQMFVDTFYHQIDKQYLNEVLDNKYRTAVFMWDNKSPLKQYLFWRMQTTGTPYFQNWVQLSELYSEYGNIIIKNNFGTYFKYYLTGNTKNFVSPLKEILVDWDIKTTDIPQNTLDWFPKASVTENIKNKGINDSITSVYGYLYTIVVLLCLLGTLVMFWKLFKAKQLNFKDGTFRLHLSIGAYFYMTALFSIYASIVVFRNVVPLIPIGLAWIYLIYYYLENNKQIGSIKNTVKE